MGAKEITVVFYRQNHLKDNWKVDLDGVEAERFFGKLEGDLSRAGVVLKRSRNEAFTIDINSYADLLNAVRISSPADGFGSVCVGHIIGQSQNLDIMDDIRRAVMRIAFAPETVPPEDHNRKVCHNCGCGC
ncbi:hypothetical protein KI811_04470 [Geobacter hydrogenophilus]|uniref:Uncharacterized protein n=1 Tax=Geobacter hydrogenophilus TaxID=40983 RepID=A0A9W6G253_9BACT|nr:hypothetical protein [Geobacter hydrogenophilus]MBT0893074.1 hypothetical protein [Geobacter hydrogenophilus]GLI39086.1 hypothetical protein GHYDROH2_25870 [Geobacter hydrogenophilus]